MTIARCIAAVAVLSCIARGSAAQDMPGALLELKFTPAPRAQIAIWLEDDQGRFIRTLALTEAVAFRGIGNRPGASQMNSGYRWPYGRREGVLPIWAARRAAAPGAQPFHRVIFQSRVEGLASRTTADHSRDDYFCLSFDRATTRRDALDAVSCASVFTSDKGRFMTESDADADYAEPFVDPATGEPGMAVLPLHSPYPPRMDVTRCTASGCYDHPDVALFAEHAREVMPEIDTITMATPPGFVEHSALFSLPASWPAGRYVLWLEINVEGDYNDAYDDRTLPTPTQPAGAWDSWAIDYGYAYRGQPSIAFAVPFELGAPGEATYAAAVPEGRASWAVWADGYGALEPASEISDDPETAPGSGADRLVRDPAGARLTLLTTTLEELPEPDPADPEWPEVTMPEPDRPSDPGAPEPGASPGGPGGDHQDAGVPDTGAPGGEPAMRPDGEGTVIIATPGAQLDGPVGPVRRLRLGRHPDELHAHEWVTMHFLAARSDEPLHRYEVRVSTRPIVDEASFIRRGRPAKTASDDPEGAVAIDLPADTPGGMPVRGEIGDLIASTRYWIGVRATDRFNRQGPISVAQIETAARTFATVSPCFIASAAYGTELAAEVQVLRRVRDRYLMPHALGRALVAAYYAYGARAARALRGSESLRALARFALGPVVFAAERLAGER